MHLYKIIFYVFPDQDLPKPRNRIFSGTVAVKLLWLVFMFYCRCVPAGMSCHADCVEEFVKRNNSKIKQSLSNVYYKSPTLK